MPNDILVEIVEICLSLDSKAFQIFSYYAKHAKEKELKDFWEEMVAEEKEHVSFWEKLLDLAKSGVLPQIFDNPVTVLKELSNANEKTELLVEKNFDGLNLTNSFLLAMRVEFYLLHPAFAQLFHFINALPGEDSPEDAYENHISAIIDTLNRFGISTPELDLLGETIQRIWDRNRKLATQGSLDPLTGILNRLGFIKARSMLSHLAFRNGFNVAVVMIDIDHFKRVNDSFGHIAGDRVLKTVSGLIQQNVRSSDIAARYGGEEFIVFLSSVDPNSLKSITEKLRVTVEKNTKDDIPVTVSIGAAQGEIHKDPEKEIDEMTAEADRCLYLAKESGRNKVEISPAL